MPPTMGGQFGLLVREPVGVVGAIIPWNAPMSLIGYKIAPALIAGLHRRAQVVAGSAGRGLPHRGDRRSDRAPARCDQHPHRRPRRVGAVGHRPRVDKITFTGSTAAGRRIASLCGERIARCTLELGGKSAAVILDDMDIETAAERDRDRRVLPHRSGVRVADAHRREPQPARRPRRRAGRGVRQGAGGRPVRRAHRDGSARDGTSARPGGGLHRQGRRRRRDAGRGRRPPGAPRAGLLRGADRVRQRQQRLDDRARRDLRARC